MIGFTVGTITHGLDVHRLGFLGYIYAPLVINIFWTSLLFLDPLVIILFFIKYNFGVYLAVLIMIFDIFINLFFGLYLVSIGSINILPGLIGQIPFGIFIISTYKRLLKFRSIQKALNKEESQ